MQREQLKNLKRSTDGTWKMKDGKKEKKRCSEEKNCQDDLQQKSYLDGQISSTMRNIGEDQKGIEDDGKGNK